ncbi:exopolysaccharide biosynthesis protein [Roseovarius sp.]|uniref:exopolysaccharide biosynthesis protein n=1 Tax=Roseovarius sp. TaxID=1486281 RepID=UPI003B5B14E6
MQREGKAARRPSLSLPILRASRRQHRVGELTLGALLSGLGETSFGWAVVVFSLVTLIPLPPGSTLITALPLLVTTGQMMAGYDHIRLPKRLAGLRIDPLKLRRAVLRLRPMTRKLERILVPRYTALFAPRNERPLGLLMFAIAFCLFLPLPLSGWFPALSLFIIGVGLVERDGLVSGLGLILGAASVFLTVLILFTIVEGAEAALH